MLIICSVLQSVESVSYRLDDLKSGTIKVRASTFTSISVH